MHDIIMESGLELERQWKEYLGLYTLADLNEQYEKGNIKEIIQICEAIHDRRMVQMAYGIRRSGKRMVLLAGPSSSGKTTTAKKLCIQLMAEGLKPIYIGTDDYYKERDEIPPGPDGLQDFESINAIDTELFNSQMDAILHGREVDIPSFNFSTGKKEFGHRLVTARPEQPVIVEGILALKPELSYHLPEEEKFRIYACPLSSLKQNDGSRIKRGDIRKIRRLVRDHAKRDWNLEQTFEMWPKVRAGENENIFPYSGIADEIFNSSQPYELAVLKKHAMPLLLAEKPGARFFDEAQRLKRLLDQVVSIEDESLIEGDSIVREFIGGGEL
ncbi:MAG: nucleoside kinase [Firmicutes bacterium]|nr:nucleoside kinase [Bacillota bacterium]